LSVLKGPRSRRGPAWGKLVAIVLACAALAAAWRYTPLSELVTAERIIAWARAVRGMPWAPVVVVLIYTPAAFVMFPRPLLTLATVVAFGPWLGFVYGMAGILLSALATYYAGCIMPPKTVERLAGGKFDHLRKVLRQHGLAAMTAIRILPVAPFALESILAGAMRLKLWHYMLGTFIGMTPGVLATSVFGDQLTRALEDPSTINWWLVAAVLIAFVVLTWLVRRWFARR
jgi:phospholipase D1/2